MKLFRLLSLTLLFGITQSSFAQYGEIDTGFGTNGVVRLPGISYNPILSICSQADGKSLSASLLLFISGRLYYQEILITRYNIDGSIDQTFSNNGTDTIFSEPSNYYNESGLNISTQADGRIILAYDGPGGLTLMRFNVNGQPDNTFGTAGKATYTTVFSEGSPKIKAMPDGSILTGVLSYTSDEGITFTLVRCDSVGALDASFGKYGIAYKETPFSEDSMINYSLNTAMAVQCDGKIVTIGTTVNGEITPMFVVSRFNADGSTDQSFGHGGLVYTAFKHNDNATAETVSVTDDGKIIVAGYLLTQQYGYDSCLIVQYLNDGSLDPTFGSGGVAKVSFPSTYEEGVVVQPNSMIIQPDQKILIGGSGAADEDYFDDIIVRYFVLLRMNPDGSLDPTFGKNGTVENSIGTASQMVMQADGKILQAGTVSDSIIILTRYSSGLNSGPVDCSYPSFPYTPLPTGLLNIFPNPTYGHVSLELSYSDQQNLNIQIYDLLGALVGEVDNIAVSAGLNENVFDFSHLPQGNYTMKIKVDGQTYIRKVIKIDED